MPCRALYASSVLATSSRPLVPASSRWTMPGRIGPPAGANGMPIASSRETSVPSRCTAVGCVSTPAGFSTTASASSRYRTGTGSPPATTAAGGDSSTSTDSPPVNANDRGRGRPSTVTRPSAIARWISARGTPRADAATASSRPGAAANRSPIVLGRRCIARRGPFPEREEHQQERADHDGGVRDVEHRPDVQVDEIHDPAGQPWTPNDPVDQVPRRATEHEPERDRMRRWTRAERGDRDHAAHHDRRDREYERGAIAEAERPAAVRRVPKPEDAVDQVARMVRQRALCPKLGHAVEHQDGACGEPQREAAATAGRV